MKSNKLVGVLLVLQVLTLIGQWTINPIGSSPAQAQVPDAGSQRKQMIDQLSEINDKLDKLITTLEGGKLQVHVATPDEPKGGSRGK